MSNTLMSHAVVYALGFTNIVRCICTLGYRGRFVFALDCSDEADGDARRQHGRGHRHGGGEGRGRGRRSRRGVNLPFALLPFAWLSSVEALLLPLPSRIVAMEAVWRFEGFVGGGFFAGWGGVLGDTFF